MRSQSGFTLIEILMVVLLVAILAAVSVPQFINFQPDAKNAATQAAVGALRTAIVNQYAQSGVRCGGAKWATAAQLNANNVTTGAGAPCTAAQVPTATDQNFVATGTLPANPWSGSTAASKNIVTACAVGFCTPSEAVNCAGAAHTSADGGWCYDSASGKIWANSANNGAGTGKTESTY